MHKQHSYISYALWAFFVLLTGALVVGLPFFVLEKVLLPSTFSFTGNSSPTEGVSEGVQASGGAIKISEEVSVADTSLMERGDFVYETRTLEAASVSIPKTGLAVVADLGEMMIRVYRDGVVEDELPILSKGKPGSLWETPTGKYRIQTKEKEHFSSIGNVWMPYSMQFFGNFFIHGWPQYPDGRPVPEGFSGGCIRLSQESAKKLFEKMEIGAPIFVTNGSQLHAPVLSSEAEEVLGYMGKQKFVPPPRISARAAIVGDLENGFLFFEKNPEEVRSIASLSKLMTALVSLEAVNQFKPVPITLADFTIEGDSGGLRIGETYQAQELLWPLLLSSSNDAAYAIARSIGEKHFVSLMNEKALSLGLEHTSFVEPSGLSPKNSSTAVDLFRFMQHVWTSKQSLLELTKERSHAGWRNIHPFVAKDTFLGGKTGFIPEAQKTIISVFSIPFGEFEERPMVVIALGSSDIRSDVERLRVWAKDNFSYGLRSQSSSPLVHYAMPKDGEDREEFSMLFAGDIMMNRGVEAIIQRNVPVDWLFPFKHIKEELGSADLTFANLEGPVSDKGVDRHNLYSFRMNPGVIPALKETGIDVVSLANNHIGDWGREAMEDTFRRLLRADLQFTGGGWNKKEALTPVIFETKGRRVGFLGFSDVGPSDLGAGEALSGIAIADAKTVENAVRQAKDLVDILVVSFHYGDEYQTKPNARQKMLSRLAIDSGAKLAIGSHPHVVQNIEEYNGGVIAYSLGNLIFDQNFSEETMSGLLLKVEFKDNDVAAVIPIPIVMNKSYQPMVDKTAGGGY